MLIQNYDNRDFDLTTRLEKEGRSEWFGVGAYHGAQGREPSGPLPPKAPLLQVAELPGELIGISGDTYPHRETFKRHGGRWHNDTKSWILPQHRLQALKEDDEFAGWPELLEGRPGLEGPALELARAEYNAGYLYGQQYRFHARLEKVFTR